MGREIPDEPDAASILDGRYSEANEAECRVHLCKFDKR